MGRPEAETGDRNGPTGDQFLNWKCRQVEHGDGEDSRPNPERSRNMQPSGARWREPGGPYKTPVEETLTPRLGKELC